VKEIDAESATSTNTRTNEAVAIATREIQFNGHDIKYNFPSHSFTQMLISIK
jgi:hypothetical protein